MEQTVMIIFGALTITTSAMVVCARNTIHSALWMVASFVSMACIFVLLHAPFLAILQIIVYAGAIMMFIIYAIMMLNIREEDATRGPVRKSKIFGIGLLIVLTLLLFVIGFNMSMTALKGPITLQVFEQFGNVAVFSRYLFTDYLLPFETVSVLLTAAVVGAVVLAKRD